MLFIQLMDGGLDMRVAVIGTGIAGNTAAFTLSRRCKVTVYDRDIRPGAHSHTVTIDDDGTPISVDIGFVVYNEVNYPDLTALFDHLGVATMESCMSFSVTADGGNFEWKGGCDDRERALLGAIGHAPDTVHLHRDTRVMPKRRRAWAASSRPAKTSSCASWRQTRGTAARGNLQWTASETNYFRATARLCLTALADLQDRRRDPLAGAATLAQGRATGTAS
jgi:predicted NAD/FAD-binding protein